MREELKDSFDRLVNTSISVLSSQDNFTLITIERISKVSGLKSDFLDKNLSQSQKSKIHDLNINRFFNKPSISKKFNRFVDEYDRFKKMPISKVNKELEISHSYYYKFLKIIELNK